MPKTLVLDNLKAAVKTGRLVRPGAQPQGPLLRPALRHRVPAHAPYTPRHKGKVERGVDYVQENALKGRTFASLDEQNQFLRDWERTVADTRMHGTTKRQVGKVLR